MPVSDLVASEDNSIAVDVRPCSPTAIESQTCDDDVVRSRADVETADDRRMRSGYVPEGDRTARRASSMDRDVLLERAVQAANLAGEEPIDQVLDSAATGTRRPVADSAGERASLRLRLIGWEADYQRGGNREPRQNHGDLVCIQVRHLGRSGRA